MVHEVLPVRSGHRVTLTFNLLLAERVVEAEARKRKWLAEMEEWRQRKQQLGAGGGPTVPPPQPLLLLSAVQPLAGGSIPFVAKLREMLAQPTWHPEGCTLGYVMQHQYATSLEDLNVGMFPRALKGGDRLLHAALCGELGLQGKVRPLHFAKTEELDDEEYDEDQEPVDYRFVFVGNDFQRDSQCISEYYLESTTIRREMERSWFTKAKEAAAVWIGLRERTQELFTLRSTCIHYGNDPTTTTVYSGVALLLEVPAWGTPGRVRAMAA